METGQIELEAASIDVVKSPKVGKFWMRVVSRGRSTGELSGRNAYLPRQGPDIAAAGSSGMTPGRKQRK